MTTKKEGCFWVTYVFYSALFVITVMGCSAMLILGIVFLVQGGERDSLGLILLLVGIFAPILLTILYFALEMCAVVLCMEDGSKEKTTDAEYRHRHPVSV